MAPLALPSLDDASTVLEAAAAKHAGLKVLALRADARLTCAIATDDGTEHASRTIRKLREIKEEAIDRQLDAELEEREAMRIVVLVASREAAK